MIASVLLGFELDFSRHMSATIHIASHTALCLACRHRHHYLSRLYSCSYPLLESLMSAAKRMTSFNNSLDVLKTQQQKMVFRFPLSQGNQIQYCTVQGLLHLHIVIVHRVCSLLVVSVVSVASECVFGITENLEKKRGHAVRVRYWWLVARSLVQLNSREKITAVLVL